MSVREGLFVESPWYGVLEIVGVPGALPSWWGTECWSGDHVGFYVTETLQPLTSEAAEMLGVKWGTKVWDKQRKRNWENEPVRMPWFRPRWWMGE